MAFKLVTHVAVESQVVEKVVALKNSVLFYHPQVVFTNERLKDRYSYIRVVVRTKSVTNVMKERSNNVLVRLVGSIGAGSGLQRVFHPVDGKSAVIAF